MKQVHNGGWHEVGNFHLWAPGRDGGNSLPLMGPKPEIELYLAHPQAHPGARIAFGPQTIFKKAEGTINYRFVRAGKIIFIEIDNEKGDLASTPKITELSKIKKPNVTIPFQNELERRLNSLALIKQELATRLSQVV